MSFFPKMREQLAMGVQDAVDWQMAHLLAGRRRWLTTASAKLNKASGQWRNVGLTLSPAREATPYLPARFASWSNCPRCSVACEMACVGNRTGRGRMPTPHIARIGRTLALRLHRAQAVEQIAAEVDALAQTVEWLAFRSQIASDDVALAGQLRNAITAPNVVAYDYTAIPEALAREDGVVRALSRKETPKSAKACRQALADGYPVAYVLDIGADEPKPRRIGIYPHSYPVIDGDQDDLWFLRAPKDEPGYIIGLYVKGSNAQKEACRESGFALDVSAWP